MNYAIIRNTNYKMKNLAGIYRHNERKNTNYSNKEINRQNSKLNYSIKSPYSTYEKIFKDITKKHDLKGMIKKVSNVMCEFIITSDKEYFDKIGVDKTKKFFQTAYSFVCNYKELGEQYILSAKVHMDEKTPHMHIVFIPVIHTKDKKGNAIDKIACSSFWKGKDSYKYLQDNFHKYMQKSGFNLERGKNKGNKHLSMEQLKSLSHYEKIKEELLEYAKQGKYETVNSKKRITYKYKSDNLWDTFLDNILNLKIRNVTINKSFFNKHGQAAQEAWFYIKDQVAFDAYMETLQELCRKDGISTKLTVCYNSLQGEKTYDIDEKIIDYVLVSYTLKVYIICTVEY